MSVPNEVTADCGGFSGGRDASFARGRIFRGGTSVSGWKSSASWVVESWLGAVDWEDREVCELHFVTLAGSLTSMPCSLSLAAAGA